MSRKWKDPLSESINKEFGVGAGFQCDDDEDDVRGWVSTGVLGFDMILGGYGLPGGRVVEIFGENASGKSLLLSQIFAEAQEEGGRTFLCDTEASFNPRLARQCGVRLKASDCEEGQFPLVMVDVGSKGSRDLLTIEDVFSRAKFIAEQIKKQGLEDEGPHVFGWDSFAATPPSKAADEKEHKFDMGLKAKAMSEMLKVISQLLAKANVTFIILNQARAGGIGQRFGPKITSPGGYALGHHASIRLRMDRRKYEKGETGPKWPKFRLGNLVVAKTKFTPPYRSCEYIVPFGEPIYYYSGLFKLAVDLEVIKRSKPGSSWMKWKDHKFVRKDFEQLVDENEELLDELQEKIDTYV